MTLAWRNTYEGGEPTALVLDVGGSLNGSVPLPLGESIEFAGVPPGTYTLTVRAINAAGVSAASNTVTLDVPSVCSSVPLPPVNLREFVNGRQVTLFWDPPSEGPAPEGFLVLVEGALTGSFPTTARLLSAAVQPGIYTVSVSAFNTCGTSAAAFLWTFEVH